MGIEELKLFWANIESEKEIDQRLTYQHMMNKSVSDTPLTHIEHTYLYRYKGKFESVEAHEIDISYAKIFLVGGGK